MRVAVLVSVVGVAVCGWLAGTAAAEPWASPTTLSAPGELVTDEAIGRGDDGTVVIAWSRRIDAYHSRMIARVRPPGQGWGAPQIVSDVADWQNTEPSVSVDADGNSLVAWAATGTVRSAYGPAGRPFEPSTLVADDDDGTGAMHPTVRFDRHGVATLIWDERDEQVHYATRPPGGQFGPDTAVPAGESRFVERPSFAVGADGTAIVAWSSIGRVHAAVRPAGGQFGPPAGFGAVGSSVVTGTAVGRDGTAVLTWFQGGSAGPSPGAYVAVAAPGANRLGPPELVAPTGGAVPAVDAAGEITLIGQGGWEFPYRSSAIWAITGTPGSWGEMQSLGGAETHGSDWPAGVAFDGTETLHVVWQHYDSVADGAVRAVMFADARPAGGRFSGDPVVLARYHDVTSGPILATSRHPGAVAAWQVGSFGLGFLDTTDTFGVISPGDPGVAAPTAAPGSAAPAHEGPPSARRAPASQTQARSSTRRCRVPSLRNLTRRAARRALHRNGCSVGRIRRARGARARHARVIRQQPARGTRRPPDSPVNIVLR